MGLAEDLTHKLCVLLHLVLVLLEHPDIDHIGVLDVVEGPLEGVSDHLVGFALAARGHNLEADTGLLRLSDRLGHALGIALMDLIPTNAKFELGETYTFIFATQ